MTDTIATAIELVEAGSFNRAQLIAGSFLAGYKGRTLEAYTTDLRLWFTWCADHGIVDTCSPSNEPTSNCSAATKSNAA